MNSIQLKGGWLVDPSSQMDEVRDLWIVDGRITFEKPKGDARVIDVSGQIVCPGLIDLGVHFKNQENQPPLHALEKLSRQLASAGFTAALVSLKSHGDSALMLDAIRTAQATPLSGAHIWPAAWVSTEGKGESMANLGLLMQAGATAFWEPSCATVSNPLLARAMEYAGKHGLAFFENCNDRSLADHGLIHEGSESALLGLAGISPLAEELAVARAIVFAEHFQARVHCHCVSTERSLRLIREAKSRGVKITASASAHHLWFNESNLKSYDTRLKCIPPLRPEKDQRALTLAVLDGTIDALASDHSSQGFDQKDVEFERASFGISSLGTALGSFITRLVHQHQMPWMQLIERLACGPARILGKEIGALREGAPANITVIDPSVSWQVDAHALQTPEPYNPWHGHTLQGRATMTLGRVII